MALCAREESTKIEEMGKKIVIAGGHLTPALAVITQLQKQDWQILFIGRKYALEGEQTVSVEYRVIKELGISFVSLITGRLQRNFTRYTLLSLLKVPIGFIQSLYYLLQFKPAVILSFGGYVALPIALAGWVLGVPVVTHEQSVVPGLATKIITRFAKKVCVSWKQTMDYLPKNKVIVTGNPIREEVFEEGVNLNENLPLIYITGGSLGAHVINEAVAEVLPRLLEKYQIIHQCGDSQVYKDYEKLLNTCYLLPTTLKKRYVLIKYVESSDIGWVLNLADLVISRAGANTVTELAALGKPAILIPLPWAGQNEQLENAQLLEKAGTALILEQKDLTGESLYQCTMTMIQNLKIYQRNLKEAQKLVNPKAGDNLLKVINEIIA